jgi:hypothetical protein
MEIEELHSTSQSLWSLEPQMELSSPPTALSAASDANRPKLLKFIGKALQKSLPQNNLSLLSHHSSFLPCTFFY